MPKPFTSETAKEAGRAGGIASAEARAARNALRADLKARKKFEDEAEALAEQLLDAALGRGVFSALDPKERAQFTLKALEYAMGRPRQSEKQEAADGPEDGAEADGLQFEMAAGEAPEPPPEDEE